MPDLLTMNLQIMNPRRGKDHHLVLKTSQIELTQMDKLLTMSTVRLHLQHPDPLFLQFQINNNRCRHPRLQRWRWCTKSNPCWSSNKKICSNSMRTSSKTNWQTWWNNKSLRSRGSISHLKEINRIEEKRPLDVTWIACPQDHQNLRDRDSVKRSPV